MLAGLIAILAGLAAPQTAQAQGLSGTLQEGNIAPIPIAIPGFLGEDPKLGADIAGVVAADLKGSGRFEPINPASFLERPRDVNAMPNMNSWRAIRAEALSVAPCYPRAGRSVGAEFRVWDVAQAKPLTGQRFSTSPQNWRRIGHLIADAIYKSLTGEAGYFDTRVVFVDETGPKEKRIKRLAIMDQDGYNVRPADAGPGAVLTPRFDPLAQEITFMTYAEEQTRVFVMNLEIGPARPRRRIPAGR